MITCITITQKNRIPFLVKSIEYFLQQTYKEKELLIGFKKGDKIPELLKEYNLNLENIFFIELQSTSLGNKRNEVISKSNGEWVCIWDDDDFHHPTRLEKQLNYCKEYNLEGNTLSSVLLYSEKHLEVRLSFERQLGWEGSLLVKKDIISSYDDLDRGEDTPLIKKLFDNYKLKTFFSPDLYIYNLHNTNTSGIRHIENIFGNSIRLGTKKNIEIKKLLGLI